MFAKLLKNEWRASRKTIGILCAIILISGIAIGASTLTIARWEQGFAGNEFLGIMLVVLIMLCVLAVALSCAASVFYTLYRFYRSRFTEEGYLTYTLPVGNHSLLLSNILMNVVEIALVMLAAAAAVGLAFGIFLLGLPWKEVGPEAWQLIWRGLDNVANELGRHAGEIGNVLLFLFLMCLSQLVMLMLSISIGAVAAKKHPILMAILVYYGITLAKNILGSLGIFSAVKASAGPMEALLLMDGVSLLTIGAGYFLMYWITGKRLNLT